ncbi:MAG: hypothetical protein AAF335_00940 [Bacteroidota bacterium]
MIKVVLHQSFAMAYTARKANHTVVNWKSWKSLKSEEVVDKLKRGTDYFISYLKRHQESLIRNLGKDNALFLFLKENLSNIFMQAITAQKIQPNKRFNSILSSAIKIALSTGIFKFYYEDFYTYYLLPRFVQYKVAGVEYLAIREK